MYVIQHCFICRPLRFHGVGGFWDRTQDCCDFGIDALSTRLDLIEIIEFVGKKYTHFGLTL
jgi:hypothetical protein